MPPPAPPDSTKSEKTPPSSTVTVWMRQTVRALLLGLAAISLLALSAYPLIQIILILSRL